jgi:hypothetical protein
MVIGHRLLVNYYTWTYVDLTQFKLLMANDISMLFLMTTPTLVSFIYFVSKVRPFQLTVVPKPFFIVPVINSSSLYVLMALWSLLRGDMAAHFTKNGIVVQQTAPYAHQQAGKIECYVHTIKEGGQMLIVDSGLPMSFWSWAVMTSQYPRNRLPTSTLPVNTTPFQVITTKKPDLSHLHIWGCQCFLAIPAELRTKEGPR